MIRLIATLICLTLVLPVIAVAETMDDLVQREGLYFKKFTNTPFSGEIKEGKSQGKIRAGKMEGKWELYHDDGQLKLMGNYESGKKEGEWLGFSSSGKLSRKENYKHGEKAGKSIAYLHDGNVDREENYRNGELDGTQIGYTWGKLTSEINYKLGKQHGLTVWYYLNGNLQSKAVYKSGKLNGPYIEYFENGTDIKAQGSYVDGKREGEWAFFDTPGKKRVTDSREEYEKYFDNIIAGNDSYPLSGVYKDGKKISP